MSNSTNLTSIRSPRVVFIDVLRAFAILMMLQGHFVDTMLAPEYRDPNNAIYSVWFFMRGLTAPIFFFSTGLVFIYLLMKDGRPLAQNIRVQKGLRRGVFLIALGYLLKFNFPSLLIGRVYPSFFVVDVLHCIGIAILLLVGSYAVHQKLRVPMWGLLASLGLLVFFINPAAERADWSALPTLLANYFTMARGSVFTPVPWVGYTMFGGVLGYMLHKKPTLAFTHWMPLVLAAVGLALTLYSHAMLTALIDITTGGTYKLLLFGNYLFWRLGHVFIVVSIFMWVLHFFRYVPVLITKIGSETLTIYSVHYIILYGTWLGIGLSQLLYRSLNPWQSFTGAVLFVSFLFFLFIK
ncbi:MAG: DUF1624 domain-containing protein [Saprospiraceae bacterium]|nr:DUF1624 domain-containing protein [Saprospiraceae bacterium]